MTLDPCLPNSDDRIPVEIHLAFHPKDSRARSVADHLRKTFSNGGHDPTAPALRIPTHRWPTVGGYPVQRHPTDDRTLVGRLADAALAVVVLLVDDEMIGLESLDQDDADGAAIPAGAQSWGALVAELDAAVGPGVLLVPVAISPNALKSFRGKGQAVRPFLETGEREVQVVYTRIAHELARRLRPGALQGAPDAPPIRVFVSHAKGDGLAMAKELQTHFALNEPMCTFYDHVDLAAGGDWQADLLSAAGRDVLLVLWTDLYSSRAWCRRELMAARRAEVGVVIVNAASAFEPWSFPLLGNAPVVRWAGPESCGTVAEVAVREALRVGHARKVLDAQRGPDDRVFVHRPDAWSLLWAQNDQARPLRSGMTVLYPEPPLGLDVLQQLAELFPGMALVSPSTRAQRSATTFDIALSVSESLDADAFGLTPSDLLTVAAEVTRALLHGGHALRYGGSLTYPGEQDDNAVTRLLAMVQTLAGHEEASAPIKNIVPWPLSDTITAAQRAKYADVARFQLLKEPSGVPAVDPAEKAGAAFWKPATPAWREAWTLGLTAMREKVLGQSQVRISLGGKTNGYAGGWPGVLEEIVLSLDAGQPTFLLGGFGGASRVVVDALLGHDRPELTAAWHGRDAAIATWRAAYDADGARWERYAQVVRRLAGKPIDEVLRNGLSAAQNLVLAREQRIERIIPLILEGLRVLGASGAPRAPLL